MIKKTISCIVLSFLLSPTGLAATNDNWQCIAQDKSGQEWTGVSYYQRMAINLAFEECKKASKDPKTCQTTKKSCDFYNNGVSTSPLWQCSALDQMATLWKSNLYPAADDAVLAAKAWCQEKSSLPETCFTSLLYCKNLNRI